MTAPSPHHSPRRLRTPLAALTLAVAATLGGATAAVAHDTLVSSSPAEGETLTSSPAEIRLTFSDDALPISPQIVVFPEGGTPASCLFEGLDDPA